MKFLLKQFLMLKNQFLYDAQNQRIYPFIPG